MMSISSSTTTNTGKHNRNIITPTPTSSPTELEVARPAKKIRRHEVDQSSRRRSTTAKPCVFPTINDPEDTSFEKTLHSDDDRGKINSAHIHIRREVLEVKRSMSGRIYFQCKLHVYRVFISYVYSYVSNTHPHHPSPCHRLYQTIQVDGVSILIARTVSRAQLLLHKTLVVSTVPLVGS